MPKTPVGHIHPALYIEIEKGSPILLGHVKIPITIANGSDYATYSLGVDLGEVAETLRGIFEQAAEDAGVGASE